MNDLIEQECECDIQLHETHLLDACYFERNCVYRNKLFEWAYRVLIQYKTPDLKLSNLLEKWQAGWKSHVHPLSLICCQMTPSNLIKQREL